MKKRMTAFIVLAIAPSVLAQTNPTSVDPDTARPASGPSNMTMTNTAEPFAGLQSGTKAISAQWSGAGDNGRADLLWGLNNTSMLDLNLGVNITHSTPTGTETAATVFGLDLALGYRMYRPASGKINPYIEPLVTISVGDFGSFTDTFGLGLGALLGVDYMFFPQFSLGAQLGARLGFTNKFDDVSFGLFTAGINATFWWN